MSRVLEGFEIIERRLTGARREEYPGLREAGDRISSFQDLRAQILTSVDEDGVKEQASPRLGEIRREISAQRKQVIRQLETLVSVKSEVFQDNAVHYREGRLVLAVRRDRASDFEGLEHGISSGGATVFVEPLETVAVNNRLRRLKEEEREEVERILRQLNAAVIDNLSEIGTSLEAVGELDFIFARADWASRFQASIVDVSSSRLELLSSRHPLLALKREVVPLDLKLDDQTRVLLISGPNAGGKTVVLKTVGLIALLASCGLHVPASPDTRIPFFRKIFIDIGDEQSIDDDLSSFTAHLANLKKIIDEADENSLILLDELGSSTSPEEGGALGMAVLDALAEKGAVVIATTHLESLKYYVEEHNGMQNAGMEFTDRPTYRLIMGIPGASNALSAASELGFPPEVIEKARSYVRPELLESSALISRLAKQEKEAEELRIELEKQLVQSRQVTEQYQSAQAQLEAQQKRFHENAAEDRKRLLAQTRRDIENLVKEIRETQASKESILKAKRYLEKQAIDSEDIPQSLPTHNLLLGAKVLSKRLKREGSVIDINERSGEALVEVGKVKMHLPFTDLEVVKEKSSGRKKSFPSFEAVEFNPRLMLRGMYAEDAYQRLVAHITEAIALGIEEVFIVHGKGTGVLRSMVMEFARHDRHVASFRVGEPGEGGDGVTVLRLAS